MSRTYMRSDLPISIENYVSSLLRYFALPRFVQIVSAFCTKIGLLFVCATTKEIYYSKGRHTSTTSKSFLGPNQTSFFLSVQSK